MIATTANRNSSETSTNRAWLSPALLLLVLTLGLIYLSPKNGMGIGFWFATAVLLYGWACLIRLSGLLTSIRQERAVIQQEETLQQLDRLAKQVNASATFDQDEALNEIGTPLLREHLQATLDGLRFGWESPQSDSFAPTERRFATPERELRSAMDVVLNVGIAGTFLSIFLSLMGDGKGLTADAVLAHLGPGLISGLYAVATNVALRLCLTTLQEAHATLEAETDRCLYDGFFKKLSPERVNPTFAHQRRLEQNVITLGDKIGIALAHQTDRLDTGLTRVFEKPMRDVKDEIARMTTASERLVVNSNAWSEVADRLYSAQENLLNREEELVAAHKTQIETVTHQLSEMLKGTVTEITTAQELAFESYEARLTELQNVYREQFGVDLERERSICAMWLAQQRTAADKWLEEAIARYGQRAETTLQATAEELGLVIREVGAALPETVQRSVEEGLLVAQRTGERLSEEMARAAYSIEQVGQSVRDQVEAYRLLMTKLNEATNSADFLTTRLIEATGGMETLTRKRQTEFETTLGDWQEGTKQNANAITAQLEEMVRSQKMGWATLESSQNALGQHASELKRAFEQLTQTAKLLEVPMEKLSGELASIQYANETKRRRFTARSPLPQEETIREESHNLTSPSVTQ